MSYQTEYPATIPLAALVALKAAQRLVLPRPPAYQQDSRSGYVVGDIARDTANNWDWEAVSVAIGQALWKPRQNTKTYALAGGRHRIPVGVGAVQMSGQSRVIKNGPAAITNPHVRFYNGYVTSTSVETDCPNAITVRASIKIGATYYQATKAGNAAPSLAPGEIADLVATCVIPAYATYTVTTHGDGGSGGVLPNGVYCKSGVDGYQDGSSVPDYTMGGGTYSGGAFGAFGPVLVCGTPDIWCPSLALVGDSILAGLNEVAAAGGDADGHFGYIARVLGRDRINYVNLGRASTNVAQWAGTGAMTKRLALIADCTTQTINQLGRNSWGTDVPIETIKTGMATINAQIKAIGHKVIHVTSIPKVTSSDSYVTLANQAVSAQEGLRRLFNATLRNFEMPLQDGLFDAAPAFEQGLDSGLWPTLSGAWTDDGTHQIANGATRGAASLTSWAML